MKCGTYRWAAQHSRCRRGAWANRFSGGPNVSFASFVFARAQQAGARFRSNKLARGIVNELLKLSETDRTLVPFAPDGVASQLDL